MKNQARHFGRLRRAEMCTAYIFILPMFAGLLLFSIIPFIQNILYSFRKMGTFGEGTFIGLKNYQDLLKDDTFWLALQNTVFYAVVGVPLVIIFSIFLAHQIDPRPRRCRSGPRPTPPTAGRRGPPATVTLESSSPSGCRPRLF